MFTETMVYFISGLFLMGISFYLGYTCQKPLLDFYKHDSEFYKKLWQNSDKHNAELFEKAYDLQNRVVELESENEVAESN